MPVPAFGRTNQAFPPVWLSLTASATVPDETARCQLVEAAIGAQTVIDLSRNPALWGGLVRGTTATTMAIGGRDIETATSADHAADLIDANLIETLSCLGRTHIDFYFWEVRGPLRDFQVEGALRALEQARQEGHIKFLGLAGGREAMKVWCKHDAFEATLPDRDFTEEFASLALERRTGVVTRPNNLHPAPNTALLINVQTANDVHVATRPLVGAGR